SRQRRLSAREGTAPRRALFPFPFSSQNVRLEHLTLRISGYDLAMFAARDRRYGGRSSLVGAVRGNGGRHQPDARRCRRPCPLLRARGRGSFATLGAKGYVMSFIKKHALTIVF